MSVTLKLQRTITGIGAIELHRGAFDVQLDGTTVGSIAWHETTEIDIPAGQHSLRVRSGRYGSRARTFDAADGSTVSYRCHGANLWPVWLVSLAVPSVGLALGPE